MNERTSPEVSTPSGDSEASQIQKARNRGILLMLAAAFCFTCMGALVKLNGASLSFSEIAFFRAAVTLLLIFPVMLHRSISFWGQNRSVLVTRSMAGFLALSASFFITTRLPLADASILNHTSIAFVALLSGVVLKERVGSKSKFYIAMSFLGAMCVIKPTFDFLNMPGLVGLLGGFCAAIAVLSIRKLHSSEHSLTIVFNFSFYATLCSLLFFGSGFRMPFGQEWFWLIAMGLFGTAGQVLMTKAYALAPAAVISPFTFSGVLFSALFGALFWSELPDLLSFLGAVLIILSGIKLIHRSE